MQNNRVSQLIQSRVSLAPMAGITDYVLRSLVRKYSKSCLLTTEMISSEYLAQVHGGDIVKRNPDHSPISYQISGHKPELMKSAAEYLTQIADMIDINMGCPVNKVVKGQDGCSLMKNPKLAYDLVQAVKDGTDKPVSVKFRLGYTQDEMNFVEFGQKMQEAGAEFITIHGRTRSQLYSGTADWKIIKNLTSNIDIPVFANGDIKSVEDAIRCMELSGADGVAVGRASMGDATLIGRIEHYFATGEILPPPTLEEKIEILKHHLDEEMKLRGDEYGMKIFRKFYSYYISGVPNSAKIRAKLVVEENYDNIIKLLNSLLSLVNV